jgi:glycosyltransferase involved in cell wall biosynthesis
MSKLRIAYVVNHAAFFVSHRLPLAVGAKKMGFDVALFTGQAGSAEMERSAVVQLTSAAIFHKRTHSRSSGMNPVIEFFGLLQLFWLLIRFRPDIVHCASPKGVLYGGIAARLCRINGLVLAISGMGYAFTDSADHGFVRKFIKWLYSYLARLSFQHPNVRVIVQNQDDRSAVLLSKWTQATDVTLIHGSGVNLDSFSECKINYKNKMVLLPARMLKDKGVREFVDAARQLKKIAPEWLFVLAGAGGYDNPSAIGDEQLRSWQAEGVVQWKGHVEDMIPLYKAASIVCLPSYREGMPKALLEAAAAGCAVVTTDVPGCREAIVAGVTGDLVPVADSNALALTLFALIQDPARRQAYGEMGRQRAIEKFSVDAVVFQTLELYKELVRV